MIEAMPQEAKRALLAKEEERLRSLLMLVDGDGAPLPPYVLDAKCDKIRKKANDVAEQKPKRRRTARSEEEKTDEPPSETPQKVSSQKCAR